MAYPNTGSTLSHADGRNKTSTGLSTNIIIKVNGEAVGAIQNINFNENRTVNRVLEVGTDGVVDSTPTKATEISGSCRRIRFDRLRISEAFSRGFVHAKSQAYPFDLVILDTQAGGEDSDDVIITTVKNVWITKISYAYQAENWIITDDMDFVAEDIYTVDARGQSIAKGGERGLVPQGIEFVGGGDSAFADIEQRADTAQEGRRGSLDISAILRIAGTNP